MFSAKFIMCFVLTVCKKSRYFKSFCFSLFLALFWFPKYFGDQEEKSHNAAAGPHCPNRLWLFSFTQLSSIVSAVTCGLAGPAALPPDTPFKSRGLAGIPWGPENPLSELQHSRRGTFSSCLDWSSIGAVQSGLKVVQTCHTANPALLAGLSLCRLFVQLR